MDDHQVAESGAFEERLRGLVQRAQQGDRSVLPELRKALDADPSLWRRYGDLALHAQQAWLSLLAGKDLLLRESVERRQEELRAELAGPDPSPLEELLVERVVACWLQTAYADALYAQARAPGATPEAIRELMRRQESSQRRYLASIRQLALVRRLLRPAASPDGPARRAREGAALPGTAGAPAPPLRLSGAG